jgi:hypothetical protein
MSTGDVRGGARDRPDVGAAIVVPHASSLLWLKGKAMPAIRQAIGVIPQSMGVVPHVDTSAASVSLAHRG